MNTATIGYIVLFAFCIFIMVAAWFFLRPITIQEAQGEIISKTYKAAGTTYSYPHGANRGFRQQTAIPTAAGYVFVISVPNLGNVTYFTPSEGTLKVGDEVNIKYFIRSVPFLLKKLHATEVQPIDN